MQYFKIISSFLSKLFSEKRFVNSVQFNLVFPPSIKSINPIQKYQHIESYACILKIFVIMFIIIIIVIIIIIINKYFNFFRKMFYTKRAEINNIVVLHIQSNPISSNIGVLIKIYYISPILYFE